MKYEKFVIPATGVGLITYREPSGQPVPRVRAVSVLGIQFLYMSPLQGLGIRVCGAGMPRLRGPG